jgi:hypothetical protein
MLPFSPDPFVFCAKTAVGGHSLHDESNGNGVQLIDFAAHQRTMIGGTLFPHKSIHKRTLEFIRREYS